MGRKRRNEKNGTAAKNKKKEEKTANSCKEKCKRETHWQGGMLDASNAPLHGRKRISDMNGNAKRGTSFRFIQDVTAFPSAVVDDSTELHKKRFKFLGLKN